MRPRLLALALLSPFSFLLLTSGASASLPEPKSTSIKPGKSIAGVKFGMKADDAVKLWGKGSNCDAVVAGTCTWQGTSKEGQATIEIRDDKVFQVSIGVGQRANGTSIYSGPLTKWKTSKGIGLGSTQYATARAYKKAAGNGGGLLLTAAKSATFFGSSGGRNYIIAIGPVGFF